MIVAIYNVIYTGSLSRKAVSEAFFTREVESELREQGKVASQLFGANTDREDFMRTCETTRVSHLYPHKECGEKGIARGTFYCV